MLVIYSTTPGHVSATMENGSPFIQIFCEKLSQLAHKENLMSIISHVINEMETVQIGKYIRQIPHVISTLGVVYLKEIGTQMLSYN